MAGAKEGQERQERTEYGTYIHNEGLICLFSTIKRLHSNSYIYFNIQTMVDTLAERYALLSCAGRSFG